MDLNKIARTTFFSFLTQGVALVTSIVVTLLVPKLLSVKDFGFTQLFIFYATFAGVFLLGQNDGVYLIYGGRSKDSIEVSELKGQLLFGLGGQILIGALVAIAGWLLAGDADRKLIFISLGIYLLFINLSSFLNSIYQALNQVAIYLTSIVVERVSLLITVVVLLISGVRNPHLYILAYVFARLLCLTYLIYKGRFLFEGSLPSLGSIFRVAQGFIKVGIPLMIANLVGAFVVAIVRQVIEWRWGIEVFGKVGLALSMVAVITFLISQVGVVLFPALRQAEQGELSRFYIAISTGMQIILPLGFFLFLPLQLLISSWLPKYQESIPYLALLLPLCLADARMGIIGGTYLKVLRKEVELLLINLACIVLCIVGAGVCAFLLHSKILTVLVATAAVVLRSIWSEMRINKHLHVGQQPMLLLPGVIYAAIFNLVFFWGGGGWALVAVALSYPVHLWLARSDVHRLITLVRHTKGT